MRMLCVSVGTAASEETASHHRYARAALERPDIELIDGGAIADEAEATSAARELAQTDADVLALITLCGRSARMLEALAAAVPIPCVIWAIGKDFAFPSSALAAGALRESGRPVALVHSPTEDAEAVEEFVRAARTASAVSRLRRAKIGVVGGLFPNLVSCRYEAARVRERLGVELVSISPEELRRRMDAIEGEDGALRKLAELCSTYALRVSTELLRPGLKLHLALKRLANEKGLEAFAIECWTGLPREIGLNPCLGFLEDAYVLACEGDVMLALSLLTAKYITGACACAGDVRDVGRDNVLTLCHCGGPASAAASGDVILDKSVLAAEQGFTTVTCRPRLPAGPVTLIRLYGIDCDHVHVACGELINCDRSQGLTVSVKLRGGRQDFIRQCLGNHYAIVRGDISEELTLLCDWLKIGAHF